MKKKKKSFWIILGIGAFVIFLLILTSTVLNVGANLARINKYVEYGFYALVLVLVYIFILNPLRVILFAPTISVETVLDEKTRKTRRNYRKVAKNIIEQDMIDQIDKEAIKNSLNQHDKLLEELNRVFDKSIKKELNKIIIKNAKTVLVSTAVSQNGRLDMLMVMSVNLKMIKELVLKCGFRPSYANLGKLSVNVFGTALIAEGLENLDISDILPQSATSMLAEIPLIKPIMSSIVQGISNALLTIRIGIVARKYLFADTKIVSKNQIRIEAFKESVKMLPVVIKESMKSFPSRIGALFKTKNVEENY